jgi:cobalt-zinc-cadmium efflux system outer membrane protein
MNRSLLFSLTLWWSLAVTATLPPYTFAERSADALTFQPRAELDYAQLERIVREGSAALKPAQRQAALAALQIKQAQLYGNPSLDGAWGTMPVGRTTPSNLDRPWANVPNYGVGVSYLFPIGKRGPRIHQAEALSSAAGAELEMATRDSALALANVLGELATATLRREGMRQLVVGAQRQVALANARLSAKFGTPLEVDRLVVDLRRSEQLLLNIDAEIQADLAACSGVVGATCQTFADAPAARNYLARWLSLTLPDQVELAQRPDLRALDAYVAASHANADLAAAQAIPDPTLRLGYLHDRFVISGNQRNSLNVSVSMPLPVFDHGQVQQRAAEAAARALAEERAQRVAAARARIPLLRERFQLQRARCQSLDDEILPKAEAVLGSLEQAVENRLIPLTDVIQARRTLSELLIERAESCGDAYTAALELIRETPRNEKTP